MDRICDFLLFHAVERPYIFRSHDEYLDKAKTVEVMLPTRPQFPIRFMSTSKTIRDEVWTRFSKAMKLKVVQVDYVLTRQNRTSSPKDLYCYFNERHVEDQETPPDDGMSLSGLDSDHEWQQYPHKHPPIYELKISQMNLEVIKKAEIWIEIPHAEVPIIPSPHLSFNWEWLARMNSLKKVYFKTSIGKHPEAVDFDKWNTAWLNSPLLKGAMLDIVSRVGKSVKFRFDAKPLDQPADWTDATLVQDYFNSKIEFWNAEAEPYYPSGNEEMYWWIQNNSRFRFVFGPYWWFARMDVKKVYHKMRPMKGSLLPEEEEAEGFEGEENADGAVNSEEEMDDAEAEDNGDGATESEEEDDDDSVFGGYDYDEGSDDGEDGPGTWDPYVPAG